MAEGKGAGRIAGESQAGRVAAQVGLAARRRFRRTVAVATAIGALGLIVLSALAWPKPLTSPPADGALAGVKADRVEVVYFHRTQRCETCLWAGQATGWTVQTYFADELASGKVTSQETDVQKPENAALAQKYRASGSSLFLNYVKGGQDHIVQAYDTYPYVGNLDRYSERLREKIASGLEVRR